MGVDVSNGQLAVGEDCSGQLFGACQKQNAMVEKDQAEELERI